MVTQRYYSTDQVIEIVKSIKGGSEPHFEYANKVADAIINELENQRPKEVPFWKFWK